MNFPRGAGVPTRSNALAEMGWQKNPFGAYAHPKAGAFTLIELVISSALMTIILTGAYVCLSSGFLSQKLVDSRAEVLQSGRVAMALMAADLRSACRLSKDIPFVGMHRLLGETEADNLDFGTRNYTPKHAREFDFCEVSYFLSPDSNGTLTLWRRRDPTPDDEPLSGGTREEIAQGVRALKLEYYDGFDWYDDWGDPTGGKKTETSRKDHPNLFGMPEAVRITLSLALNPKEEDEEPMVFQTVARLNLAALSQKETSSSSSGKEQSQEPASPGGEQ
jgi:type II secretion system protein J